MEVLDRVSSGSGLNLHNGQVYVVSDNMSGFFVIDTATLREKYYPFSATAGGAINAKHIKYDFENSAHFQFKDQPHILSLGSGSKTKNRENLLLIKPGLTPDFKLESASPFYTHLKKTQGISAADMNLEAIFSTIDSIYFLNRASNNMIAFSNKGFENMILSGYTQMPKGRSRFYRLPALGKYTAGFSGACPISDTEFLFTASVEKTTDWYNDGAIAGSFIGIANTSGKVLHVLPLTDVKGKMLKEKVEGIELIKAMQGNAFHVLAISDNDNAKSTWFEILLNF